MHCLGQRNCSGSITIAPDVSQHPPSFPPPTLTLSTWEGRAKSFVTYSMKSRSTSGFTILLWHMLANEEGVPGKHPLCTCGHKERAKRGAVRTWALHC